MHTHRVGIPRSATRLRFAALSLAATLVGASTQAATPKDAGPFHLGPPPAAAEKSPRASSSFGNLPISFEPNVGQAPAGVRFLTRGTAASLTATGAALNGGEHPVTLEFVGASSSARASGACELQGKANYLVGNDPSAWKTNVPTFRSVRVEQLYAGVELVWYGKGRSLEYDLVLKAGADPGTISFTLDGSPAPEIAPDGALVAGDVRFERPVAYQEVDGERQMVPSGYVTSDDGRVGFRLGDYDHSLPLVIDPEIAYTFTFADSSKDISLYGLAVDSTGAAYVAGRTRTEGAGGVLTIAAYVAKLNPEGTALVYSTTISGSAGNEEARDIEVDASGNAFITGFAFSSNFPTTTGAFQTTKGSPNGTQDAFVAKLGPEGNTFVYSSFLGGSGGTSCSGIAIDASGNAHVTGFTQSSNFPTTSPAQGTFGGVRDAFLTKVNAAGSAKAYSTYLGGSQSDTGNGVAIDASGNAYVVGVTTSMNFPVTAGTAQVSNGGGSEGFWAKYNSAGQRVASTYLGGSGFDSASGVDVDDSGNSYLTGETASPDFPLVSAIQFTIAGDRDAFVTALNPSGTGLVFSTFYGGSHYDYGTAISFDDGGNIFIVGTTESSDFPSVDPIQPTYGGGLSDAFILQLATSAESAVAGPAPPTVRSASPLGGSGRENGTTAQSSGSGSVVVGTIRQKDSSVSGHDEAQVTTVMAEPDTRPDLAITDGSGDPYNVGTARIHLVWMEVSSKQRCSGTPAPGARFGMILPEGSSFIGARGGGDVSVVEKPPVGQSGTVIFEYLRPVPVVEDSHSGVIGYILVALPGEFGTEIRIQQFANIPGDILNDLECNYGNNQGYLTVLYGRNYIFEDGSKLIEVILDTDDFDSPKIRIIANAAPSTPQPRRVGNGAISSVSYKVYTSTHPNVQIVPSNLFATLPSGETVVDVSGTPPGSYFVITMVSDAGEGPPSNEVGGTLPTVTKLKVSASKIVADGSGFAGDIQVIFADQAFVNAPKLKKANTRVIQKGPLLVTGEPIGMFPEELLPRGSKTIVLFVNGNGSAVAAEYVRP